MASEVARNAKILKICDEIRGTPLDFRRNSRNPWKPRHSPICHLFINLFVITGTITYETNKNAEIDDAESLKDDEETEGSEDKESEPEEDLSAQVKKIKLNEDYKIGFIINVHILKTLRILWKCSRPLSKYCIKFKRWIQSMY